MKEYRVSYYIWSYDRHGDKDFTLMEHWCSESNLTALKINKWVDELEVHEEREVQHD